ncbi:MAG: extracellular solute-binding protein [Chloroflexota bacterium]
MKKQMKFVIALVFGLSLMLTACQPKVVEVPGETVIETVVVEVAGETIIKTVEVEKIVEVTPEAAEPVTLVFWSHWAEEVNKKAVLITAIDQFEQEHPNVTVEVSWWQKSEMFPAMRNAFTAGEGFPDIFYFDRGVLEFITAGWLANLEDAIDWSEITDYAKAGWTRPGPDGEDGVWAVALETATDEIYYNKDIFDELGIVVPDNYQFTADEFYDICVKIREAGYDPFANAVGDSTLLGSYLYSFVLTSQLGEEGVVQLWKGEKSWKDPDVVEAMEYIQKLIDIPVYPKIFSTMSLGESHGYFHTDKKAAMFLVGSWYPGRAFISPESGGQPADFRLGMLRYPSMPNGQGNDLKVSLVSGSISVAEMSPQKDLAFELLQIIASTETGNAWLQNTAVQTGIVTSEVGGPFLWYFEEYDKTHEGQQYSNSYPGMMMNPGLTEAWNNVLCQGLPLGQVTLEEALDLMEEARLSINQ